MPRVHKTRERASFFKLRSVLWEPMRGHPPTTDLLNEDNGVSAIRGGRGVYLWAPSSMYFTKRRSFLRSILRFA